MKPFFRHVAFAAISAGVATAHASSFTLSAPERTATVSSAGSIDYVVGGSRFFDSSAGPIPLRQYAGNMEALGYITVIGGLNGTAWTATDAEATVGFTQFSRINSAGQYTTSELPTSAQYKTQVSGLALTPDGVSIQSYRTQGALVMNIPYEDGYANGGQLRIQDIQIDLSRQVVVADLVGRELLFDPASQSEYLGPEFRSDQTDVWSFSAVSGSTANMSGLLADDPVGMLRAQGFTEVTASGQTVSFSAVQVISGLRLTSQATDFMARSLGLTEPSLNGATTLHSPLLGQGDWGSISITSKFDATITSVPEPGTHALMGLGLLAVLARVARRTAHSL